MKKNILILAPVFLLSIVLSCNHAPKDEVDNKGNRVEYEYLGNITDSLVSDDYRTSLKNICYDNGIDPYGVYNKKNGIISSPHLAYIIAKAILANEYGEKQIEGELPLQISLINNRFWLIEGRLYQNAVGGVATIVIKKDDGQVQYIKHSK